MSDIPCPCPVCKGLGVYYDQDHRGRARENICTACHGSCVMYLHKQQYARRIGDTNGYTTSREYSTRELHIIGRSKDAHTAFRLITEAGFTDRNFHQVRKYRDRLKTRKRRKDEREGKVDIKSALNNIDKAETKEES